MKILSIVGTRPQLIKSSVITKAFLESGAEHSIINTGQHYDHELSDVFFQQLFPKNIGVKSLELKNLSEVNFISQCMHSLSNEFELIKPDFILCYGDTNSTVATALTASKLNFKLGHIEAGLRDHSKDRPEEKNRILTDNLSDLMFCPTPTAYMNLQNESKNINMGSFYFSGDVMRDVYMQSKDKFICPEGVSDKVQEFCLFTLHRQENVDNKDSLLQIARAINKLSKQLTVYFPLHPRTEKMCKKFNIEFECVPLKPLNYFEFQWMVKKAKLVITDSGGVQKETFFHGKKSLLIYKGNSGWNELQNIGAIVLTEAKENSIFSKATNLLNNNSVNTSEIDNFFGDGNAAKKIVQIVCSKL